MSIPLLNLPERATNGVIKLMDQHAQLKLSMCSALAGESVKKQQIRVVRLEIGLSTEEPYVRIHPPREEGREGLSIVFSTETHLRNFNGFVGTNCTAFLRTVKDPLAEMLKLAERFKTILINHHIDLRVNVSGLEGDSLKALVDTAAVTVPYTSVEIKGEQAMAAFDLQELTHDELNYIFDKFSTKAQIRIYCKIPDNFQHKKAMKFKSMIYSSSMWITYEKFVSIRRATKLCFSKTNMNINDMNNFLLYWINCEEDMMTDFRLDVKMGYIDPKEILACLVCIYDEKLQFWQCYVKANDNGKRKRLLGRLFIYKGSGHVEFKTFPNNEESSKITLKTLGYIQDHKNVWIQIKDVKEKMAEKRNELRECVFHEDKLEIRTDLRELIRQRRAFRAELAGIKKKLGSTKYRYAVP